ncbi:MAG: transcriptional repressor [Pseudomonadota bacterium]
MKSIPPLEHACQEKGLHTTEQKRAIARALSEATDHRDIAVATLYRTIRLFADAGIVKRHECCDAGPRDEEVPDQDHDHLINVTLSKIIEFTNEEIRRLQQLIAKNGYTLLLAK